MSMSLLGPQSFECFLLFGGQYITFANYLLFNIFGTLNKKKSKYFIRRNQNILTLIVLTMIDKLLDQNKRSNKIHRPGYSGVLWQCRLHLKYKEKKYTKDQ